MGVIEPRMDDAAAAELVGAYALHACEPAEVDAVEALLTRDPRAAEEAGRLVTAAAWIGASEALAPPTGLRDAVLSAARARRPGNADDPIYRCFMQGAARFDALVETLTPGDLEAATANGLGVRGLVVHLAAMESMIATGLGESVLPSAPSADDIDSSDVGTRTEAFVAAFAGRPLDDARAVWQASVDAIARWAGRAEPNGAVPWLGIEVSRDTLLTSRAFEMWTHADDIRRAIGRRLEPPPADELHLMADFSMHTLDAGLAFVGREHPGRTARVVLTGAGGGSWLVPLALDGTIAAGDPDVEVRADVVAWCRRVSERLEPAELEIDIEGDPALAADIVAAASAFATL